MEMTAERPVTAQEAPKRRVGTFTLGLTLLGGGGVMLASTFLPEQDFSWALRLCPLILICLGVETLIAARGNGRIKYDWAGILLSFLLACGAAGLYAAAWGMDHYLEYGDYYSGNRIGNDTSLFLDYRHFNTSLWQDLTLRAGDVLEGRVVREAGSVSAYVMSDEDGDILYEGNGLSTGTFTVEIPRDGIYEVCVTGRQAAGSFRIKRAETPPAEPGDLADGS